MPGPLVHYTLTRNIAEQEGMSHNDAVRLGRADLDTDGLWPGSVRWTRHFNPTAPAWWLPVNFLVAVRRRSLAHLGYALHSLQDSLGHGILGLSHLRQRYHLMERDPDVWETMAPVTRRSIEATTRLVIRAYLRLTRERTS